jgi:hypothetical protein
MVTPSVFTSLLVEWTDPRKNVCYEVKSQGGLTDSEQGTTVDMKRPSEEGHLRIGIEAAERCLEKGCGSTYSLFCLNVKLILSLRGATQNIDFTIIEALYSM